MAGVLSISTTTRSTTTTNNNSELEDPTQNLPPLSAVIAQWQVQYSRFISYRSSDYQSTHPSLVLLSGHVRKFRRGTWISTASHTASLKLVYERSSTGSDDAVLFITVPPWVPEEHRVSKMHFSWPQVSCLSGYPARGSRAVFVSYKDQEFQIQKFALYFVAVSDAEKFMSILKEILGDGGQKFLQCSEMNSELSSQAEVVPLYEPTYRNEEDWQHTISEDNSIRPTIQSTSLDASQELQSHEMSQLPQDPEAAEIMPAFPPSFTELLKSCRPAVEVKPKDSQGSLKTQFLRYLEGVSVEEMLTTVENVMSEMGDDLILF